MSEWRIGLGIFLGAATYLLVVFFILPGSYIIAVGPSMLIGFLGYNFGEAKVKAKIAVRQKGKWLLAKLTAYKRWRDNNKPFIVATIMTYLAIFMLFCYIVPPRGTDIISHIFVSLIVSFLLGCGVTIEFTARGAAKIENCYWSGMEFSHKQYLTQGASEMPLTYGNFFRWLAKGSLDACTTFIKCLADIFTKLFAFFKYLFFLLCSKERVFCSIFGAIGGVVAYFSFTPTDGVGILHQACSIITLGAVSAFLGWAIWLASGALFPSLAEARAKQV